MAEYSEEELAKLEKQGITVERQRLFNDAIKAAQGVTEDLQTDLVRKLNDGTVTTSDLMPGVMPLQGEGKTDAEARENALQSLKEKHGVSTFGGVGNGCKSADEILKDAMLVDKPATQREKDQTRALMEKQGVKFCKHPYDPNDEERIVARNKQGTILCNDCLLPIFEMNITVLGNPFS